MPAKHVGHLHGPKGQLAFPIPGIKPLPRADTGIFQNYLFHNCVYCGTGRKT